MLLGLPDDIAIVVEPGETHEYVTKPTGSGEIDGYAKQHSPCNYGIPFAITSRMKLKKAGFVSGRRFHWLQAASKRLLPHTSDTPSIIRRRTCRI